MSKHTYAGHTLTDIKATAEAATPGPWTYFPKPKFSEHHVSLPIEGAGMRRALFDDGCQTDRPEADARFIAVTNPASVLAMAARIEEQEQQRDQLLAALTSTRRELQACQAVIHLAGGFDPAYVTGAKAALSEADAAIAAVRNSAARQSITESRYPRDLVESDGGEV